MRIVAHFGCEMLVVSSRPVSCGALIQTDRGWGVLLKLTSGATETNSGNSIRGPEGD